MNKSNDLYEGGFFTARKKFSSDLWLNKPSQWKVIWEYIYGNVNHEQNCGFERGEGFFNLSRDIKLIGCDITYDQIRHFIQYAKSRTMISTRKSTRGIIIKVNKYDYYQTLNNYKSTTENHNQSTMKAQSKHNESTTINKNVKNDKNERTLSKDKEKQASRPKKSKDLKPLPDELMSSPDDRDHSIPRRRLFGDEKIDWLLDFTEHITGYRLTGQERWNRIYARHLLNKIGCKEARVLIEGLKDTWWFDKVSQFSTIYKNHEKIAIQQKEKQPKPLTFKQYGKDTN